MEEYLKFMDYKIQYDAEFKLPEEFDKLYYQKGKEVNKIAYLNYGWSEVIIPNPTNSYYDYLYYNLLCNKGYDSFS